MNETAVPPVDRSNVCTTDGQPLTQTPDTDKSDGQHANYAVLCDEERAKGFVRPVRASYEHVGIRPKHPVRDLTPEEHARYDRYGYVKYEAYPEGEGSVTGRFWTEKDLKSGCGQITSMGKALAETYARDPKFYGSTFCSTCGAHFPVGEHGEFVWMGTDERVGS